MPPGPPQAEGSQGTSSAQAVPAVEEMGLDERTALEHAIGYAVILLDPEGVVLRWYPGAERTFGYPAEAMVGQRFDVLFLELSLDQGKPALELQKAALTGIAENVGWHRRNDGTLVWVEGLTSPIRGARGEVRGFIKICRDNTGQKSQEDELRGMTDRLAVEARTRSELFRAVAHELGSPLTALRMQLDLLERKPAGQDIAGELARLRRGVGKVERIHQDLLDLVRLENHRLRMETRTFDLAAVVRDTAEDFEAEARGADIALEVDAPRGILVDGDPDRLAQVVANLLGNALKYTPPGGRVRLVVTEEGGEAVVRIHDSGLGLTPDQAAQLFEPFSQVHDRPLGGSGLGLFISKGIVERHHGRIWADSEGPGRGSTFGFAVPREAGR